VHSVVLVVLLAGCQTDDRPMDPRAYRGSDREITLDQAMEECAIQLPNIALNVRFFVQRGWDGLVVWLTLATDPAGYGAFLKDLGLQSGDFVREDHPVFGAPESRFGWNSSPDRDYIGALMTRDTEEGQGYTVTVDVTRKRQPIVYLKCTTH
jgi:hypothetical protein